MGGASGGRRRAPPARAGATGLWWAGPGRARALRRGGPLRRGRGLWWAEPGSGETCCPALGCQPRAASPEPEPEPRGLRPMAPSPRLAAGRRLQLPLLCLLLQGAIAILFAVFVRYNRETDAALWHGGNHSNVDNEFYFRYPSECR